MGFMDNIGGTAALSKPSLWSSGLDAGLGALSWVGGTLDKYDNAFRNLIGGRPGAALRSAIPFSDTLGIYDPKTDYMSGQDLLQRFGILDQGEDKPLLSAEGGLGLAAELVAAPSNLLPGFFGIKALTKAGKLAGKVAPHLDEVSSLAKALGIAKKADEAAALSKSLGVSSGAFTKSATEALAERLAALEGRFGGKVLDAADNALPENELMRMLSGQASNLGQEAAYLERGGLAPRLGKTAAERAQAGQEALFSIGGEYRPFGIGPKIDIPQIDLVTSPWLQQGISDVGGMIRNAPGIKQALDLFQRSPINAAVKQAKGLQEQVAREGAATVDEAERLFNAGQFDEAASLLASIQPEIAESASKIAPVVQETQQRVARATGMTAPEINKMASDFIKDGTAPEAAASMLRALGDGVEGGAVPKELETAVNSVRRNYKEMLDFEQPWNGLKDLGDPYAMHAVTKQGRQFFESVAKAGPEAQQRFLDALNEVRVAKGLDPLAIGAESVGVRGTPIKAATGKASGEAARLLERAGIGEAFMEEAMNGSMYARKYRGLTVNEINDVAKKFGAKADVFESNPFKQLKQRGLQHAKIKGMVEFVEGLEGLGVAKKVNAADVARSTPDAKFPGVSRITMTSGTSGYVSDILQQGGTGNNIVFETAKEAAEAGKALRWMADDGKMATALKWYDQATRIMKSAMTRGFPSFHMRNRFENRIKSNLQDVPFFGQHNKLGELASQGKDFSVKLDDGTTMNYASLMSELRAMPQHKILSAGQVESITKEVADSLASSSAKVGKFSLMDRLEGITENIVNKIEPFAAAPAVAAGKISSGVSTFTKGYSGAALENADKLRHYIYKRMKGYAPKAAAADVMEAQFDYTKSAMNSFERDFMNRTLLFYGYTRSVIPFMVEQIAKNSGKITPWLRLANAPGKDENLPPWLREGMAVPLSTDEKTGLTQYARSLGTPFEAAVEPFAGFFAPGNAADKLQRGGQKMASGLNPLIKAPAEFLFEKDLFLGRDIDALRKFPEWSRKLPQSVKDALGLREITSKEGKYLRMEGNAWGAWALRNSPLGRLSGTIGKGMDERKAVNDVLLNLFTGANITTFDKEREARFRQREAAIKQLKELEKLGLTKEFTAWRTTDEGKDSEEARALLNLLAGR